MCEVAAEDALRKSSNWMGLRNKKSRLVIRSQMSCMQAVKNYEVAAKDALV